MRSLALFALVLTACSSSGSKTLSVVGDLTARGDSTSVEIAVNLGSAPVVGANVVLEDRSSEISTTLESPSAGIYRTIIQGYPRETELKITSGDDDLTADLDGPAPHVITRPPNDAIVRRGDFEILRLIWEADGDADLVIVEPQGAQPITLMGDVFEAEVPLSVLPNGDQTIGVTREISIVLEGGTEGSRIRTRYKVDNRFSLE